MTASAPMCAPLSKVSRRRGKKASAFLCVAALALLAGCESAPPPPPPPPPPPVAVAPPPPPPVLLPRSIVELASVYEGYVHHAAAIDAAFTASDKVEDSLKTAETYQSSQLQQGQAAYGAIVALQDPTFVAALREFAKDPQQRSDIAAKIMMEPSYAASFKGADSAAGLVISAFSDQAKRMIDTGARIHQAAYDVQHQSWSKADVVDRPGRLALAKALSADPQKAIEVDTIRLSQNASGAQAMGLAAPAAPPPYTNVVDRSLALAAMAALGEGGDEYAPQLTALLADPAESQCLHLAKLDLYQCLSVAKPSYEDVFCMGQHAVGETGQCLMKASVVGYVIPPPIAEPPPEAAKPQHVAVKHHRARKKAVHKVATTAG